MSAKEVKNDLAPGESAEGTAPDSKVSELTGETLAAGSFSPTKTQQGYLPEGASDPRSEAKVGSSLTGSGVRIQSKKALGLDRTQLPPESGDAPQAPVVSGEAPQAPIVGAYDLTVTPALASQSAIQQGEAYDPTIKPVDPNLAATLPPTDAPPPPGVDEPPSFTLPGTKDRSGERIGQYEIIRKLGEGGMGVVYLARDTRLGRRVAIKVLRTQNAEITRRFIVEARTTARCTHENIVVIHDVGKFDGSPFMVLEYLEGKDLTQYQELEKPSVTHAVEIMAHVCQALARAHKEGIVHRDLKPDNIFITKTGTVKVLDFGIAKLVEDEAVAQGGSRMPAMSTSLGPVSPASKRKSTGITGTVAYMSPEQWLTPDEVDHRADIWAVGLTLFELLTERNPLVEQETPLAIATFLSAPQAMPSANEYGAKISRELCEVIARCLEKKPAKRYPDATSLLKALEPFLPGRLATEGAVEFGPFAGLRAFQEEDAGRFFGRSRELGTLITRLKETPLMAVVGPSGVGKSSFLRAGVIPALKNSGNSWQVLTIRPGRAPLRALAEKVAPLEESAAEATPEALRQYEEKIEARMREEPGYLGARLRNYCRSHNTRLLLFVDQFEELYTLGTSADERRAFTTSLVGAADDAVSPVRAMLSIRADFLGRTTEDSDFVSTLSSGVFFLGPPSRAGLQEALVRPAEMMGYRFESTDIVNEMIEFLDGYPNGLPLLQFTAAQLWEARDAHSRLLTTKSYRGMGGVEGALVSHADSVYNHLSEKLQNLCRSLFMYLVTTERTRAVRSMRELQDLAGDKKSLEQLVTQLVDSRLWVIRAEEGEPIVEIVHESLIDTWPSLRRWLEESHEDSVFIDQLLSAAHQWEQKNRGVGLLWRGEMVDELAHFQRHYQRALPEVASDFALAVTLQARRSARTKKLLGVAVFIILVGLLAAASVGLIVVGEERNKAAANAKIAEDRLEEQLRAEQERELAEEATVKAEQKSGELKVQVDLSADQLAEKNKALEEALTVSENQHRTAIKARERAEDSETDAKAAKLHAESATRNAEKATQKVKALLNKEKARTERLDAQIGTLIEKL